jgi:hypothetical protein
MSLRKPPQLTPELLAASRRNCQHSTGPRSQAGKERVKLNGLKHGLHAAPENHRAVMQALGENPREYEALAGELATSYGPGDALWRQQLEDLAQLYWRRRRLERMQTGLMRSALEQVEERQRARAGAIAALTFNASQCDAVDYDLAQPTNPCLRLRLLLSVLGVLLEQVRQRVFKYRQQYVFETYYKDRLGWGVVRIRHLLSLFFQRADYQRQQRERELRDFVEKSFQGEAQVEPRYQELLRLLENEVAGVKKEFEHQLEVQEERDAIERDTCLAPEGEIWERLLRQEAALDRAIDRKVRILLAMRREHALGRGGSRAAPTPSKDEREDRAAEELSKLVGLEGTTESPIEEFAPETPNSPDQSRNVIENKEPAPEKAPVGAPLVGAR